MNQNRQGEPVRRLQIGGVLAVLAIDAFTGKIILNRDFTVEIAGAHPPVRKRDGYFVFSHVLHARGKKEDGLSWEEPVLSVRLGGSGYQEKVIRVSAASVSATDPVVTVRMYPDASYPYPPSAVCMEGRLSAGCILSAALLQKESSLRLAEDYHAGGGTIAVYRGDRCNLTGSLFYLETEHPVSAPGERNAAQNDGAGGCFLSLREAECGGTGRYRLSAPLPEGARRTTARLYPACMHRSGEQEAHYFFAFPIKKAAQGSGGPGGKEAKTGCDILCRLETPKGIKEFRFFVENGETRIMDFGKDGE